MIPNEWYAVLSSHELKASKLLAARRFGRDLVFFRTGGGEIGCVDSLCAHRKASLAKGEVAGDHIKCPFHGIEYDAAGRCVYVPSEGRASTLDFSRLHLDSVPVREVGGIVFAWYGEGQPDREPRHFDIITNPSYSYDHTSDAWSVDYSRVIENQLDVSHLAFVHHNTIGRGNRTLCNGPKVEWLDDHTMRTSANNEPDEGQTPKPADQCVIKETNLTFMFPNMWLNHISDKISVLAFFVPVDDAHSIIALRFYDKITGIRPIDRAIAWFGSRANLVIERQDKRVVETQLPKKTGLRIGESLVAADLPIIEYRSRREELQGRAAGGGQGRRMAQEGDASVESQQAMYRLTYGLFVCTVSEDGRQNGCIINTAAQVASAPILVSLAVSKANLTCEMLERTGRCNVSVLDEDAPFEHFRRFGFQSGRDTDKFSGFDGYDVAQNGIAYVTQGANAYLSLRVREELDLGSHTLFVCEPEFTAVLADVPSATYAFYQEHIRPKPERVGATPEGKTVWRCVVCGFEWVGEELPDDYVCPICRHPKADFEKIVV